MFGRLFRCKRLDDLTKRIEELEKVAHEPQNFIDKCERNEQRIRNLEAHPAIGWRGKVF